MIPLGRYRKLRKTLRKLVESEPPACEQGRLLKKLIAEGEGPNVVRLRPSLAETSRVALIDAGKRYCLARCGGCPLTDSLLPPA